MHLLDNIGPGKLPITLGAGRGARLQDTEGRWYWDFYGGHAVTLLGQGHPRWVQALADQARTLSFATTLFDVPVRRRAAEALCRFTGMDRVFFVNSGAEANEAALKVARRASGRSTVVAMEQGFHGRSMGALGVTWRYRDQHAPAHGTPRFVPFGDLRALEDALDDTVAAVITEPIQGIAGVVEPPSPWLAGVRRLCDENDSVMIVDEIQSGVGRAGVPLVCTSSGIRPDLVTVGKGVGGGFPVAALLLTEELAATVAPGEHGTTFGGSPLACAAVEITLRLLEEEGLLDRALRLGERMRTALAVPGVRLVRGAGAWFGLVLEVPARDVAPRLLERGFLVGTASDPAVLRLAPPATLPTTAVDELASALEEVLRELVHAPVIA